MFCPRIWYFLQILSLEQSPPPSTWITIWLSFLYHFPISIARFLHSTYGAIAYSECAYRKGAFPCLRRYAFADLLFLPHSHAHLRELTSGAAPTCAYSTIPSGPARSTIFFSARIMRIAGKVVVTLCQSRCPGIHSANLYHDCFILSRLFESGHAKMSRIFSSIFEGVPFGWNMIENFHELYFLARLHLLSTR